MDLFKQNTVKISESAPVLQQDLFTKASSFEHRSLALSCTKNFYLSLFIHKSEKISFLEWFFLKKNTLFENTLIYYLPKKPENIFNFLQKLKLCKEYAKEWPKCVAFLHLHLLLNFQHFYWHRISKIFPSSYLVCLLFCPLLFSLCNESMTFHFVWFSLRNTGPRNCATSKIFSRKIFLETIQLNFQQKKYL